MHAIAHEDEPGDAKPMNDMLEMEGMVLGLARKHTARGVITMEDLAEQSVDDLLDMEGMDAERAAALIMTARAPWFAGESN